MIVAAEKEKTVGFRVTSDMYDKVQEMIRNSGDKSGEWFEKFIAIAELQNVKNGAAEYAQDLNEVEIHTARIYEAISNMVSRAVYTKDNAVKEIQDKVDRAEGFIADYQDKAAKAQEDLRILVQDYEMLEQANAGMEKTIAELRAAAETNKDLIDNYKERINDLSELVTRYKGFSTENEQLKENHANTINELTSKHADEVAEIQSRLVSEVNDSAELRSQVQKLQYQLQEKEVDKEKALLQLERQYQSKLGSANEEYSASLKGMYDELSRVRKQHEDEIKEYLDYRKRYEVFSAKMEAENNNKKVD